jgi:hypothetical protein
VKCPNEWIYARRRFDESESKSRYGSQRRIGGSKSVDELARYRWRLLCPDQANGHLADTSIVRRQSREKTLDIFGRELFALKVVTGR